MNRTMLLIGFLTVINVPLTAGDFEEYVSSEERAAAMATPVATPVIVTVDMPAVLQEVGREVVGEQIAKEVQKRIRDLEKEIADGDQQYAADKEAYGHIERVVEGSTAHKQWLARYLTQVPNPYGNKQGTISYSAAHPIILNVPTDQRANEISKVNLLVTQQLTQQWLKVTRATQKTLELAHDMQVDLGEKKGKFISNFNCHGLFDDIDNELELLRVREAHTRMMQQEARLKNLRNLKTQL